MNHGGEWPDFEVVDVDRSWSDRIPWPVRVAWWKAGQWLASAGSEAWWSLRLSMRPTTRIELRDLLHGELFRPGMLVRTHGVVYRVARVDGNTLVCVREVA